MPPGDAGDGEEREMDREAEGLRPEGGRAAALRKKDWPVRCSFFIKLHTKVSERRMAVSVGDTAILRIMADRRA